MDKKEYGKKLSKRIAQKREPIGEYYPHFQNGILGWVKLDEYGDFSPDEIVFATPLYAPEVCGETIVVSKSSGDGELVDFEPVGNQPEDLETYYDLMEVWFKNSNL